MSTNAGAKSHRPVRCCSKLRDEIWMEPHDARIYYNMTAKVHCVNMKAFRAFQLMKEDPDARSCFPRLLVWASNTFVGTEQLERDGRVWSSIYLDAIDQQWMRVCRRVGIEEDRACDTSGCTNVEDSEIDNSESSSSGEVALEHV